MCPKGTHREIRIRLLNGEKDTENRLMDMGKRGGGGEMYGDSHTETYITVCKIDSQGECAVCLGELKQGSVSAWRGGMGSRFKREGTYG